MTQLADSAAHSISARASAALVLACVCLPGTGHAARPTATTRSSSIVLTKGDRQLLVANQDAGTVSVFKVRTGQSDTQKKVAEIPVGEEPRSVTVDPKARVAFVTNTASGTVSVIALVGEERFTVVDEIPVGTEPRGCALAPNGTRLFVANHTAGTVSVIDTARRQVIATVPVGGNPTAVTVTDDGDRDDADETVFVTRFFSELIAGKQQPFDDARQGIVVALAANGTGLPRTIALSPLATTGFDADRSKFCPRITPGAHSDVYCPDPDAAVANDAITKNPQGAFPNQLASALLRGGKLYLPNIGAAPAPPVKFNVNIQALVHVIDVATQAERADLHTNLNAEVKAETEPDDPSASLDKLFGNDLVAIDADRAGRVFLIVSRGGNFAFVATATPDGRLTLGTPVVRFQSGNIPNGVAVNRDGSRAYLNNEVGYSVTAIDLTGNRVLARDIPSSRLPEPGTFAHAALAGKLAFFTALGIPEDGAQRTPIREIVPLTSRGKASDNGWSSCGSCHPDGLSDNVTWSFADGPRNTIALDAFFSKQSPADQRISNWSAVRGSVTDFNNNSRGVQGGVGFAGVPPQNDIYNHGLTQGVSDALDLQTLWIQTIRSPILPKPDDATADLAARSTFEAVCATCHGGAKWTKSQVLYLDNPAFTADPAQGGQPRDPGVVAVSGQIVRYDIGAEPITVLDDIGAFDGANPLEIKGAGGAQGTTALGSLGFNAPSLLGVGYTAPYFHDGSAATLADVFERHLLTPGTAIADRLDAATLESLTRFLASIDGRTATFSSEADDLLATLAGGS